MRKKIINKKNFFMFIVIMCIFFSSSLVITFDSTHYLKYVDIFETNTPFSTWDIVRGPVFPIMIYISDILFGKSSGGMLFSMFLYYITYCMAVHYILKKIFNKPNNIIYIIIYLFCIINPVVLGYFHTMLTEYGAITLTMISLLISWNWWKIEERKDKIFSSLYFIIFLTISYFFKQPYICTVFVPMIISIVLALKKKFNIERVLYYIGTLIASIALLLIAIPTWNKFLEIKGVDLNTGRDSSSILSKTLLNSIEGYKVKTVKDYKEIKNDKYITKKEKKIAKKELKQNKKIYVIEIYDNKKLLEKDILKLTKTNNPSGSDTVLEIVYTFFKHPKIISKTHAKNYCALSSLCIIETNDNIIYRVSNKLDFTEMFENKTIAFKTFRNEDKFFYYPEDRYESVKNYIEPVNQSLISKLITNLFTPTSVVYKFVLSSLLLFIILVVIIRIILRKKIKEYELYLYSLMFLLFSFITLLINDYVGSVIDRYSVVCFVPGIIGITASIMFIIKNMKRHKIYQEK